MAWILDLDGVVWRGDEPIAGSAPAIARLRAAGERVVFLTNNSSMTRAEYVSKLARHGIEAVDDDILTSALAGARVLEPGSSALVCGGPGVRDALAARGVEVRDHAPVDTVIVGWHQDFTFDSLADAASAIRDGARFVATNDDPTYPAAEGVMPGCGSIVAFVATAAGRTPEVAGKPNPPMAALVREALGDDLASSVLVGDRASTDGAMAKALGVPFVLVRTGIAADDARDVDEIADDLAAAVAQRL